MLFRKVRYLLSEELTDKLDDYLLSNNIARDYTVAYDADLDLGAAYRLWTVYIPRIGDRIIEDEINKKIKELLKKLE